MASPINSVTPALMSLALDAAELRQQAVAANIANHTTPGYAPVTVDFESQLQQAQSAVRNGEPVDAAMFANVRPRVVVATDTGGLPAKVRLDEQVASSAMNVAHYNSLTRGLNRYFSILSIAASDGKR